MNWKSQLFPPRPALPADLTTIDYMKAAALTLMIVDHLGYLIFPEILWLRVIGRLCVPLWFFLIGYARARDVPPRWMIAGVILLISSIVVGLPPLPLSVLFTMALTRLLLDAFWKFAEAHEGYFWWMILLLIFFAYPSGLVIEYGTLGFLLACVGFAVRNRSVVDESMSADLGHNVPVILTIVTLAAFGILESLAFGFSLLQVSFLAAGLLGIYFVLQGFESKVLTGTAENAQAPLIRFMGRHTLEIYVIHLLILKAVYGLQQLAAHLIG